MLIFRQAIPSFVHPVRHQPRARQTWLGDQWMDTAWSKLVRSLSTGVCGLLQADGRMPRNNIHCRHEIMYASTINKTEPYPGQCMRPTNERRRYNVTSSLIGWRIHKNDPSIVTSPLMNWTHTKNDFSLSTTCGRYKILNTEDRSKDYFLFINLFYSQERCSCLIVAFLFRNLSCAIVCYWNSYRIMILNSYRKWYWAVIEQWNWNSCRTMENGGTPISLSSIKYVRNGMFDQKYSAYHGRNTCLKYCPFSH